MADSDTSTPRGLRHNLFSLMAIFIVAGCALNVSTWCGSYGCKVRGYPTLSQIADRKDNLDFPRRRVMSTFQQALHCAIAVGLVFAIVAINAGIREDKSSKVPLSEALTAASMLLFVTLIANGHTTTSHTVGVVIFLLLIVHIGWLVYRALQKERVVLLLSLLCIAVFLIAALIISVGNGWKPLIDPSRRSIIAGLEYAVLIVTLFAISRLV